MAAHERFLQATLQEIRDHALLENGTRVLVAVSGGLDSTVLAHALSRLAPLLEIDVELVHVDHAVRGTQSEREGVWVEVMAERLGVKCHRLHLALPRGDASQAELRRLRRAALFQLLKDTGCARICTAHHADDNAETLLMRAMSGSGVRGLGGISPRDGVWVRPLLWAPRHELEEYARAWQLGWVEDPSNARGRYLRNRLRHEALPLLEELREGATSCLAELAARVNEEEREWADWCERQFEVGARTLPAGMLEKYPRPLRRRLVRAWLRSLQVEPLPQLIEALAAGGEATADEGVFLLSSDSLIFSPEPRFGSAWREALPVETGRRVELPNALAWTWLQQRLRASQGESENLGLLAGASSLTLYLMFRPQRAAEGALHVLSWERLPWPLRLRAPDPRQKSDRDLVHELLTLGVPSVYARGWPLLCAERDPSVVIAALGLWQAPGFEPQAGERIVHVEARFEAPKNAEESASKSQVSSTLSRS